ncbi:hypothetical protein CC78DRAFT_573208 [Lojkania enalia]|uniref:Uncharacterized protein n=1 Tax=Lojkania enalia TaxID=147567 RepID=A0A9P4TRW4_9PLEO|nr:hypothetical protein CC78DRAFT_573208 [Didymosphaeria enalia]
MLGRMRQQCRDGIWMSPAGPELQQQACLSIANHSSSAQLHAASRNMLQILDRRRVRHADERSDLSPSALWCCTANAQGNAAGWSIFDALAPRQKEGDSSYATSSQRLHAAAHFPDCLRFSPQLEAEIRVQHLVSSHFHLAPKLPPSRARRVYGAHPTARFPRALWSQKPYSRAVLAPLRDKFSSSCGALETALLDHDICQLTPSQLQQRQQQETPHLPNHIASLRSHWSLASVEKLSPGPAAVRYDATVPQHLTCVHPMKQTVHIIAPLNP